MAESRGRTITLTRILWGVLVLLAVVLVAQNSADTTVQIFGWTVQAPLFMVIVAAMVIGWALMTLGTQAWSWRRRKGRRHDDRRDTQDKHDKDAGGK